MKLTDEQLQTIRELFPDHTYATIMERMQINRNILACALRCLGLVRTKEQIVMNIARTKGIKLITPEQERIIREMSPGHTKAEIARKTGLTRSRVRRYLKALDSQGAEGKNDKLRKRRSKITPENERLIIELFPTTMVAEISRRLHLAYSTVASYIASHGLMRTEEQEAAVDRARKEVQMKYVRERTPEYYQKARERQLQAIRRDRIRWLNGMPQKTKFHFSCQTREKMSFRRHLRKRGYIESEDEKNLFYYDANTRRSARSEMTGETKYRISFKIIEESDEED